MGAMNDIITDPTTDPSTLAVFPITNGRAVVGRVLVQSFEELVGHNTPTAVTLFAVTDDRGTTIHEAAPAAIAEALTRAGWANADLTEFLSGTWEVK